MSVTLNQILMLVGTLDDSPGFDAPRERYRRFLTEHVAEISTLSALVDDAQRLVGEQPHRALQDAIVVLGRFLGFETTFGTYQHLAGAIHYEGQWRSRHRLHVLLEILSEQTERIDPDDTSRALAALAANTLDDAPRIGMAVVTPLFAARGHVDAAEAPDLAAKANRRIVSTRSLLWLAAAVSAGRMKHEEVVALLLSGQSIDMVVELLRRFSGQTDAPNAAVGNGSAKASPYEGSLYEAPSDEGGRRHTDAPEPIVEARLPADTSVVADAGSSSAPAFWAVSVDRSQAAGFEQLVQSAVARRRVLGVAEDRTFPAAARPGDAVCFFLPGKGVLGHADIAAPAEIGLQLIRESDRFDRLYRVKDVVLYEMPIVPDLETQQMLAAHHQRSGLPGPLLVPLAEHKFALLTTRPAREAAGARTAAWPAVIDRASRSRA